MGELSLEGSILQVPGVLRRATLAASLEFDRVVAPAENASEAPVVDSVEVVASRYLTEAVEWLNDPRFAPLHGGVLTRKPRWRAECAQTVLRPKVDSSSRPVSDWGIPSQVGNSVPDEQEQRPASHSTG